MNKRLDLARQALRLLPSKTNPRIKRWQAPDEEPPKPQRGKAALLSKFVLRPDRISDQAIEVALAHDVVTDMHAASIEGFGAGLGKVGDYLKAKDIRRVAERMAKETERIKEFLLETDNPQLRPGLALHPITSRWSLPAFTGSYTSWQKNPKHKYGIPELMPQMVLDPVEAALLELEPFSDQRWMANWDERSYTPEQLPWHEAAHLVDVLQSKRAVPSATDDHPSLIALKGFRDAFENSPHQIYLIERVPRLEYPLATPIEYLPVLTEIEVTNPEDIDYLQDVLGEDIRGPLRKLHGNTLPHRPWKKP